MKYNQWVKKLTVGSFPYYQNKKFDASKYDVVINMSDEFSLEIEEKLQRFACKTHWFPMNECKRDIGLNSIYGALTILWLCEKKNQSVYLHCHAGVNRSVTVQCAYHYLRTGTHLDLDYGSYINPLIANCHRGYLPPKAEMEGFLNNLALRLGEEQSIYGGYLDTIKLKTLNNF